MEMPVATRVQRLIQEILESTRQFSESLQQAGVTGRGHWQVELRRSSSAAPTAEPCSTATTEPSQQSKTTRYPDWSENLTDLEKRLEGEVTTPESFGLEDLLLYWQEYLLRKERHDEDTKWIEGFKKRLDQISGGAPSFTLNGEEVATYKRTGKLSLKRLESEHPEIVARYTRLVQELKFDRMAFEAEEPKLHAQYKAKVFLVK